MLSTQLYTPVCPGKNVSMLHIGFFEAVSCLRHRLLDMVKIEANKTREIVAFYHTLGGGS